MAFFHGGEVDFPLLFDDLDLDTEMLFPHALKFDSDVGFDGFREIEVFDAGKAFATGVSGFGEEGAGFDGVEFEAWRGGVVVGTCARGCESEGGEFAKLSDFFGDAFSVDGVSESLPDFGMIEGCCVDVEAGEVSAEEGTGMEPGFGFEGGGEGGGDHAFVHDEVGLAGEEVVDGGVGLRDGEDFDGVHGDVGGVPVARVFAEAEVIVEFPGVEEVGAVADDVLRFEPRAAVFFDGRKVDGREGGEGAEVDEVGSGILKGNGKGERVWGGDADLGEVRESAGVVSGSVGDDVELGAVVGTEGGVEDALPGAEEVGGGDGVAIAPLGVGAEVESVVFFVRRDVPAFGDAGARGTRFVDAAEAFE